MHQSRGTSVREAIWRTYPVHAADPVVHAASRLHDGYMAPHILYGVPHSLYTGKSRAYLRKQGFTYVERTPADPRFRAEIVPRIGRGIIPVLVTPDGEVIQDTVDILDHFEDRGVPVSARPPGARQRVLAHVAELYAVVTLTRHAMHYRWSYLDEQRTFLTDAFTGGSGTDGAAKVMARVREVHGGKDYDPEWGKRMRGEGQWSTLIDTRFRLAVARLGLSVPQPALRTDLFRPPPRAGDQLSLF